MIPAQAGQPFWSWSAYLWLLPAFVAWAADSIACQATGCWRRSVVQLNLCLSLASPMRICRIAAFVALAMTVFPRLSSASDRYVAWLADGTRLSGRSLSAWPVPGSSFRFENRELLDAGNPVRLIRDRQAAVLRT